MDTSKWETLSQMSPAKTGALVETPSLFDDFWGTVINIDFKIGEDETDGRFYRQGLYTILIDGRDTEVEERYSLPTDEKTGEPLVVDGHMVRPNKNSKAGRQEELFATIGVPWGGDVSNILGIHGHWVRKGTRRTREEIERERINRQEMIARGERPPRRDMSEFPYGRYMVAWDYYDNEVRKWEGLEPITATPTHVVPEEARVVENVEDELLKIANGRSFLDGLQEARASGMEGYFKRDVLERFVEDGKLMKKAEKGKPAVYYIVEGV